MTTFDSNTVNLADLNLIEASAGTGKTYTLAELYLRLILEKGLTVDQILVVTYTKAATQELRDRLRQKLVDARDALLDLLDPTDIEPIKRLISAEEKATASRHLNLAIQSFDEAAIFTIHGFCQRVLGDFAFESGLPFELELVGDDVALLQAATDDFWRREVVTAGKDTVAYLVAKNETPESLLKSVRNLIGKPYLIYLPVVVLDVEQSAAEAQVQFERVQTLWPQEREAVIETLNDTALLSQASYKPAKVKEVLQALESLLAKTRLPSIIFKDFAHFTQTKIGGAVKKGHELPECRFWSACDRLLELCTQRQTSMELQRQQLRVKLLTYLQETLPQRKQQQQTQSYDDLLLNLEQALNGKQGDWLVEQLRNQYPAALIDEFQDTDPIQYASFNQIYAESGLATFLVGDPKQAIYSFRGADIFTYLRAKESAQHIHTLTTNWRSHPKLVAAINTLFTRQNEPFYYQNIPFQPVGAAREGGEALLIDGKGQAPFQILWAKGKLKESGKNKGKELLSKGEMTLIAVNETVNEITHLLNRSVEGNVQLYDQKSEKLALLMGGDIAVLVRNSKQGAAIQKALQARGINSVQQGKDNIFESDEAQQLERILLAIAQPSNASRVKAALVTSLWGVSAVALYELEQDDQQWQAILDVFYELHQLWQQYGFMRMFRQWMMRISVQQHSLTFPNGERILTNLNHLIELIQTHASEQKTGMEETLHWLSAHRQSVDPNDETGQLRLESDAQLVKIITIHKSKGLEYPLVFCPFLWDANLRAKKNEVINFYRAEDKQGYVAFSEPDLSEAAVIATQEEQAEDRRLLYVALTRAKERCVIVWGPAYYQQGAHVTDAALFDLLHPNLTDLDGAQMQADLEMLVAENAETMSIATINNDKVIDYQSDTESESVLAARTFNGTIQPPWLIGSFSGLTRASSNYHDVELPDYDAHQTAERMSVSTQASTELNRFSFPRGAQAGVCLHALFEYWDFTSQDTEAMQILVGRTLLQYGFDDEKWSDVACQWLSEVLATPLDDSRLRLADLTPAKRLDELEFYFPVADLTVKNLQQALLPMLDQDAPLATVINRLSFSTLSGFMKGFIDLVFEHKGRFYVVDYKSNHLGDSAADYQADAMDNAMISHDYPLQYAIYSLALHRYLKLRMPDYDPEQHFGGVYYLFIRGMHPAWCQGQAQGQVGSRAGVFFDKPSLTLLDALDSCMRGDSR